MKNSTKQVLSATATVITALISFIGLVGIGIKLIEFSIETGDATSMFIGVLLGVFMIGFWLVMMENIFGSYTSYSNDLIFGADDGRVKPEFKAPKLNDDEKIEYFYNKNNWFKAGLKCNAWSLKKTDTEFYTSSAVPMWEWNYTGQWDEKFNKGYIITQTEAI